MDRGNGTESGFSSPAVSPRKVQRKPLQTAMTPNPKATPIRVGLPKKGIRSAASSAPSSPVAHLNHPRSGDLATSSSSFSAGEQSPERGDTVKVLVRVRPLNENEITSCGDKHCLKVKEDTKSIVHEDTGKPDPFIGKYDAVLGPTSSQEDVFQAAGQQVVEHCMSGFNSSIFCYGQTGAGKTHTMIGEASRDSEGGLSPSCGLVPRVFEALFKAISEMEQDTPHQWLRYSVKCSFLEIYNEEITDLLAPTSSGLQIRDGDIKKGLYVQGLSETEVVNADDVLLLIGRGSANRHMAATRMNERSSRSHSVFTATIEAHERTETGLTNIRYSKLNLIDLAGSERTGKTGVTGDRLTEAKSINRSLTVLGRVITALVDRQKKPNTHVPYRDSRLTFLLQESLGGNSKTCIVANVSPSADCAQESYSTLLFAANAKSIKNRAVVNEDVLGDMKALQLENSRLQKLINELQLREKSGETEALRQQLEQTQALFDQNNAAINQLRAEQSVLRKELGEVKALNSRLNDEGVQLRYDNQNLNTENEQLKEEVATLRDGFEVELCRWRSEMQQVSEQASQEVERVSQELKDMRDSHTGVAAQLEESRAEARRIQKEAKEEAVAAAERYSELQHETDSLRQRVQELEVDASALRKKVQQESNNVVKYKKMVGEIGRLIDWAQAASPALLAGRPSLGGGAGHASNSNSGSPSSSSQLIPAIREGMRLSLEGKTVLSKPGGGVGAAAALTPLNENTMGRGGVVWSPVTSVEAAASPPPVKEPSPVKRRSRRRA